MTEGRILICGTGRAGTSFLVRLLTRLGYDTGYTPEKDGYDPDQRAGCELETNLWDTQAAWDRLPRIVKSPYLSEFLQVVPVPIEHVLIPVRDLAEVAQSRIDAGVFWGTDEHPTAEKMAEKLGLAVAACMTRSIPFTLMQFPRLIEDARYCLHVLRGPLVDLRYGKKLDAFEKVHAEVRAAK